MPAYDNTDVTISDLELKALGHRIRRTRHRRSETIEQVALRSGLSASLISQVERGIVSPSVSTLWRIAQALDKPMGFFFGENVEANNQVVRKDARRRLSAPRSGLVYELLSPDMDRAIEFLMITIKPGDCEFEHFFEHEGEECGVVVRGALVVEVDGERYHLEQGDSIYYPSDLPHNFGNPGNVDAVTIWAMTPPSF